MTAKKQAAVIRTHAGTPASPGQHPLLVHHYELVDHIQLASSIPASTSSSANPVKEAQ